MLARLDYSWLSHDDGTLALAAQEVLRGKWPHLDFDTPYSGGLSLLNALLFRVGGEDLATMRYGLVVAALVGLAAAAWSLTRDISWPVAAFATAVAAAWSIGVYPTPMPSWYQVFLALAAGAALLGFYRSDSRLMLGLAGFVTGVAILAKVTGLFTLGSLLLVIGATMRGATGRWLLIWGPVLAGTALVGSAISWQRVFVLVLPLVLLGYVASHRMKPEQLHVGWLHVSIFLGAALLPVAAFMVASAARGGLVPVLEGWFVTPRLRFEFAASGSGGGLTGLGGIIAPVLVLVIWQVPRTGRWAGWSLCTVGLAAAFWNWAYASLLFYLAVTLASLTVASVLLRYESVPTFKLVWPAVLTFSSLLTFPGSDLHYALYLVPPAAVALLAVSTGGDSSSSGVRHQMPAVVFAGLLMTFLGIGVAQGAVYRGVAVLQPPIRTTTLELTRASFEVEEADALYNALIPRVVELAGGRSIYAGPDLPQVYALSGLEPAAPVFFDFLTARFTYEELPHLLDLKNSEAIVINWSPEFSNPIPPSTLDTLQRMYPMSEAFGDLELRWRED